MLKGLCNQSAHIRQATAQSWVLNPKNNFKQEKQIILVWNNVKCKNTIRYSAIIQICQP